MSVFLWVVLLFAIFGFWIWLLCNICENAPLYEFDDDDELTDEELHRVNTYGSKKRS